MGTFTVTQLVIGLVLLVLVIVGTIIGWRLLLRKRSASDLTREHEDKEWSSPLAARNKYPDVNIFRSTSTIFLIGLAASFALVTMAFNYTTFEDEIFIPDNAFELDEEIEIEPPRTAEPPPPPPPPPPPVIEEVPDELIEEDEQPEFETPEIDPDEEVVYEPDPEPMEAPPPPPPPPPPPEPEVEEIFTIVEDKPRFPGCEDKATKAEKEACAQQELLKFLYKNLSYPTIARENGVEGTVVVTFVVEKNGKVTDARIIRDIGAGCGEEALRVVEAMNSMGKTWTPGKQRGRPVRVQFTLPVKFKLE